MVLPDASVIVQRYVELRNYIKAENDAFAERLKPYQEAMKTLAGAADLLMKQTGQTALKTEHGTAFYKHGMSVTCEDPVVFLDFVFQYGARQFLTSHVAKEAVEQYMDGPGQGHPPPGVKTTKFVEVQFRKA
jgi:hypothetical protein